MDYTCINIKTNIVGAGRLISHFDVTNLRATTISIVLPTAAITSPLAFTVPYLKSAPSYESVSGQFD
jgi:hypothetical protein